MMCVCVWQSGGGHTVTLTPSEPLDLNGHVGGSDTRSVGSSGHKRHRITMEQVAPSASSIHDGKGSIGYLSLSSYHSGQIGLRSIASNRKL